MCRPYALIALIPAFAVLGCEGAGAPAAGTEGPSQTEGEAASTSEALNLGCAWPYKNDMAKGNLALPDTSSTYFTMPYLLAPGESLVVRGTYPSARYFAYTTYDRSFNAVDHTADVSIAPDLGDENPFATAAARAGGRYTVTFTPGAKGQGAGNALSAGGSAAGAAGILMLRVYLPNTDGDLTGSGGLPTVAVRGLLGRERRMTTCVTQSPSPLLRVIVATVFPDATATPPATPEFTRAPFARLFANPDNGYVGALATYEPGRVLIVRAKAPTFPDTRGGASASAKTEVRYFSICQNTYVKPYPVVACAADDEIPLDATGSYTVVVSTPEDRPKTADTAHGVTWLPWGETTHPAYLVLRNMLPASTFPHATLGVPVGGVADGSNMGDYAPVGRYCEKATFELGGAAACAL